MCCQANTQTDLQPVARAVMVLMSHTIARIGILDCEHTQVDLYTQQDSVVILYALSTECPVRLVELKFCVINHI